MSSSPKLESYLRTYRLRAGLTQRDVAMLLGLETASIISKTEKSKGTSSILILLGYCVLFEAHPEDLVPGILKKIENTVQSRAHLLNEKLRKGRQTPMVCARIKFLEKFLPTDGKAQAKEMYEPRKKSGSS